MSHSWHDDVELKMRKLDELAEEFKQQHGVYPTFWLDKVPLPHASTTHAHTQTHTLATC